MSKLLTKTIELLNETKEPMLKIHDNTGLSYYWLNMLKYSKKQVDPAVGKVEKLYEYLSGKQLEV